MAAAIHWAWLCGAIGLAPRGLTITHSYFSVTLAMATAIVGAGVWPGGVLELTSFSVVSARGTDAIPSARIARPPIGSSTIHGTRPLTAVNTSPFSLALAA